MAANSVARKLGEAVNDGMPGCLCCCCPFVVTAPLLLLPLARFANIKASIFCMAIAIVEVFNRLHGARGRE